MWRDLVVDQAEVLTGLQLLKTQGFLLLGP